MRSTKVRTDSPREQELSNAKNLQCSFQTILFSSRWSPRSLPILLTPHGEEGNAGLGADLRFPGRVQPLAPATLPPLVPPASGVWRPCTGPTGRVWAGPPSTPVKPGLFKCHILLPHNIPHFPRTGSLSPTPGGSPTGFRPLLSGRGSSDTRDQNRRRAFIAPARIISTRLRTSPAAGSQTHLYSWSQSRARGLNLPATQAESLGTHPLTPWISTPSGVQEINVYRRQSCVTYCAEKKTTTKS